MASIPRARTAAPIVRAGLTDQVHRAIEQRILDLEFEPGSRLVIDQLARGLGVSSTPVRDALTRLASERLVEFEPYVGFMVRRRPSIDEIRHSFEARAVIEPTAAALGARRRGFEMAEELEAIEDALLRKQYGGHSDSFLQFIDGNRKFHSTLVEASGNPFLIEAWRNLHHDELVAYTLHGRGVPDLAEIREEHGRIIREVQRADADAVEQAVADHVTLGCGRIVAALRAPA